MLGQLISHPRGTAKPSNDHVWLWHKCHCQRRCTRSLLKHAKDLLSEPLLPGRERASSYVKQGAWSGNRKKLGLNRLRQQCLRAVAQDLSQRIAKTSWLRKREEISFGHAVSLLRWRSGGVKHPHGTPPHPFVPSPTFAHTYLATVVMLLCFQPYSALPDKSYLPVVRLKGRGWEHAGTVPSPQNRPRLWGRGRHR